MIRLKWFELFTDHSAAIVAQRLGENHYDESSMRGFELINITTNRIDARFIQQETITETSVNPFGDTITTTYPRFTQFNFRILKRVNESQLVLCIHAPPRSLRNFVSALNNALDGDCAIGEINIDIRKFIELIRTKMSSTGVKVVQAVYFDVPLTTQSICKVQIAAEYDAIRDFEAKLGAGRLERATFRTSTSNSTTVQFDIGRKCALRFDDSQWDDLNILDEAIMHSGG